MKYNEYKKQIEINVFTENDFRVYLTAIENDEEISDLQYENLRHFLIEILYERN